MRFFHLESLTFLTSKKRSFLLRRDNQGKMTEIIITALEPILKGSLIGVISLYLNSLKQRYSYQL